MDSDDIAKPDRCERSLYALAKHPEIDMLGAYIDEFDSQTGEVIATKKTPLTNKEIHKYARRRNPFNNQTLVYKKSRALSVGGYSNIKRCEDYEFVVKMLADGARGINLDKTLVMYRVTANNYERRRNWANTKSFVNVRWKIFRMGYSNLWDCSMHFSVFIFIMLKSADEARHTRGLGDNGEPQTYNKTAHKISTAKNAFKPLCYCRQRKGYRQKVSYPADFNSVYSEHGAIKRSF